MARAIRDGFAGAAAGFAATVPMTVVMEAGRQLLPPTERDPLPPRQVTANAADAVGIGPHMTETEKDAAAAAAHFGFGTSAGAVYGLLAPQLPVGPVAGGVGFGLAVWAVSYLGWLPTTGLYKRPDHEPAGRHAKIIVSHVVWGAALGLAHAALAGRPRPGESRPR
jgi:uncharacterized membrane protein YagU involved in acid resistance